MASASGASAEALPLPKGGGSTRGLGDGFTPDLNRGTGSYAIEIQVPKGFRSLTPRLVLAYNTANGDSPFGYGWNLGLPRIQIDTDTGVADYLAPEYLMDGETLTAIGGDVFRPRVENAFQRIRKTGDSWEVTDKGGNISVLGGTADSRLSGEVLGANRTFAWLVSSIRDTNGNQMRFAYLRDGGNLYLERVTYAAFEVGFTYEPRPDPTVNRRAGFAITQALKCRTVNVRRADDPLVIREYRLEYDDSISPGLLIGVLMRGSKRQPDGSVSVVDGPPVAFTYAPFDPQTRRFRKVFEGVPDRPGPLGEDGREIVDIDGDALPDIVQLGAGRPRMWRNSGDGRFLPPVTLPDFPQPLELSSSTVLFDADGRGTADVVELEPAFARYYPNNGAGAFERPRFLGGKQPLSFSLSNPDTSFADVNGDGRVDLVQTTAVGLLTWENRGGDKGFSLPKSTPRTGDRDALPDVRLSEPGVFVTDMTGDGLPDIVHVASGLVEYWPSLGGGGYERRQSMANPPQLPRNANLRRVFLADVDGTGTSDMIYVGPDSVTVWRNLGGVRFGDPIVVHGTPETPLESVRLVDLLGTGNAGVLWSEVRAAEDPGYRFLSFTDTKPFVLTHINEGTGNEIRIDYGSSSGHAARDRKNREPWRTALPIAVAVVDRITRHDLVTGAADSSEIFYHDGRWDPDVRRFRGFGRVTVKRTGDIETQEVFEEYRYLVGAPGEPDVDGATGLSPSQLDRARRGQLYLSTFFSSGTKSPIIRQEETRWRVVVSDTAPDGTPVLFPQVTGTEVQNLEGGNHPRVVTTEYEYDPFGNVTRERRSGAGPAGDDDGLPVDGIAVVTETEYAVNLEDYVVDRVARVVRRDDAGAVAGEVRHYYDGPDRSGLPLGVAGAGLLRRQEEIVLTRAEAAALYGAREPNWATLGYHDATRVDGAAAVAVNHTRYDYSGPGMIMRRVDAFGGETRFEYDPDGLLVVRMTNAVGHVRTASYDRSWQLIEQHTFANGAAIQYRYDGLGRLRATIQPEDTAEFPTVRYTPEHATIPTSVKTERRKASGAADTYDEVVYFDGQGREIQRRSRIEADQVRVSGILRLNRRGDPIFKGQPQFAIGLGYEPADTLPATPGSRYEYDAVGRLAAAFNPENRECRSAYTPWTATISDVIDTDPADPRRDTPRIQRFDAFGRLSAVTLIGDGASRNRAAYSHDVIGRLVASTDLAGRPALRDIKYDGRGLRLHIDHAAAGSRTVIYDARSRLVSYWDERDRIVDRSYDAIGRTLTESADGAVQETYHYDLAPAQTGRLGRVDDNAGSVTFSYDALGRVTAKTRTVLGQSFNIGYDYEPTGLQSRITYPDGSVAVFARGGDGRVQQVAGLLDDIGYDGAGRLSRMRHANGVEESFSYADAGHLETLRFSRAGGTLYDAALTHDAAGHLTGVKETSGPDPINETYDHNALGHLVRFSRSVGAATAVWDYDADPDGNLLRAGEMNTAQFEYDFALPGALTRRTLTSAAVETFGFDAAGHMTNMAGAVLEWDARGRLVRMTKPDGTVAEMVYDYRGARVVKRVTDGGGSITTRYVDELYEDRAGVGTAYVFAAGRLAGRFRGGGTRHLHVDHRGSVVLVTRGDGSVDGRGWFGPYGRATESADADGSRQMAGMIFDSEIGLYYCNQRFYSPALGRFLSPDPRFLGQPERQLDTPEAHNLYVYAAADPVDYIDPTGESFWSTLGKILAGIVVVIAVVAAVVVVAWLIGAAGGLMLAGAAIGAVIGLATDGWEGAAMGAMMGATIGINVAIGGPLGIITFLGVFPGIRKQDWYHSLAGWSSWLMPASWPGHILGLGVFLANGIAHVFGSDNKIESMKFDWKHGQIMSAGGEYGGTPFPWLGMTGPSHSLGGFAFWSNSTWAEGGNSWKGIEERVDVGRGYAHETGHMLSNALFGFWQGVVNAIENMTTKEHDDRFFEKIAQSNVPSGDRDPGDQVIPIWT